MDIQTLWNDNVRGLVLYARQWIAREAEDVVQDAFLKLLTATPPPDHPKAWLYRVVRNTAIDRHRKTNRHIGNIVHCDCIWENRSLNKASCVSKVEKKGISNLAPAALFSPPNHLHRCRGSFCLTLPSGDVVSDLDSC